MNSPESSSQFGETPIESKWQNFFYGSTNKYFGWVKTVEEAMLVMKEFEIETTTKFSCFKAEKNFGATDPFAKSRKVYYKDDKIPFDGSPYFIIASKVFDCQHGPDRKTAFKAKLAQEKAGDHSFKRTKFLPQNTMKFDCPAKIQLSEVIKFTDMKITSDVERLRRNQSSKLKGNIATGIIPKFERRIYINLPENNQHKEHVIGEAGGILQPIDKMLVEKIEQLVGEGVRSVNEMKRHLRQFVKNELFQGKELPPITNRRYFPNDVDVRNHMYKATIKTMMSKIDQENLEKKIQNWQKDGRNGQFFIRPCALAQDNGEGEVKPCIKQKLLFAHQTKEQKRLLGLYGDEIALLDATYKTTRYELPLFFIVVKTNVNYMVVGSFVIQNETTEAISEALEIFRGWNPNWKPEYFMTDFCQEEIHAIESTFEGTVTYICDFHREQCWERWLRKSDNGLTNKREEVLQLLRQVAKSQTNNTYQQNLSALKESEVWRNHQKLKNWFEKTWLVEAKRWVWAFRQERFLANINTNNGVERQNESLKHQYLKDRKKNSLSGMVSVLVEEFFPDKYKRYVELNTKFSKGYKRYNKAIPTYLHNKPRNFLKHCMARMTAAEEILPEDVLPGEEGHFKIKSQSTPRTTYNLHFGSKTVMPKCTCHDFNHTGLPCKHFFSVFNNFPKWQWHSLPEAYRESPHLTLDNDNIFPEGISETQNLPENSTQGPPGNNPQDTPEKTKVHSINEQQPSTYDIRNAAHKCRETLKQFVTLTYNIENLPALHALHTSLKTLLEEYERHQVTDDVTKDKPKVYDGVDGIHSKEYLPLPVRPKKNPFTSRFGSHATMMKAHYKVNVPVNSEDVNKPPSTKQHPHKTGNVSIPVDSDIAFDDANKENVQTPVNSLHVKRKQQSTNPALGSEDEISITYVGTGQPPSKRKKRIIDNEEIAIIQGGRMLRDTSINTAQNILHDTFPDISGLEDTTLGPFLQFSVQRKEFVQILHDPQGMHWVCVSNIGCKKGVVNLYDSLFHDTINKHVCNQIASMLFETSDSITVNVKAVQQQTNGVDCGLFALAFATSLLHGQDPSATTYKGNVMRNHLLHCLKTHAMTPFPQDSTLSKSMFSKNTSIIVDVHCICRLPWHEDDKLDKDKIMVQCDQCDRWFHKKCEKIPDQVIQRRCVSWFCSKCLP